jgi:hypothetical protein
VRTQAHGGSWPRPVTPRLEFANASLTRSWSVTTPWVLVDSDDRLHPTRVAAARDGLATADIGVCALRLVDVEGRPLGSTLGLSAGSDVDDVLPLTNVFGLSNSAYRSELLRRCLPIPSQVLAVDWYLVTRAWLMGAAFDVDPLPRMDYRQYESNMTAVRPPFQAELVQRDTERVRDHLALVKRTSSSDVRIDRWHRLESAITEIEAFRSRVIADPLRLSTYVNGLETLPWVPRWWAHVAHPALRHLWTEHEA